MPRKARIDARPALPEAQPMADVVAGRPLVPCTISSLAVSKGARYSKTMPSGKALLSVYAR